MVKTPPSQEENDNKSPLQEFRELVEECEPELVELHAKTRKEKLLQILDDVEQKNMDLAQEPWENLRALFIAAEQEQEKSAHEIDGEIRQTESSLADETTTAHSEEEDALHRAKAHQSKVIDHIRQEEKRGAIYTLLKEAEQDVQSADETEYRNIYDQLKENPPQN